jgi:hypothetical protein
MSQQAGISRESEDRFERSKNRSLRPEEIDTMSSYHSKTRQVLYLRFDAFVINGDLKAHPWIRNRKWEKLPMNA